MRHRPSRWTWLTLFALGNLVCWIGVAVIAGLAVGDYVDLGVETLLHEGQATAVAVWKQASGQSVPPSTATVVAQAPMPARADKQGAIETARDGLPAAISGSAAPAVAMASAPGATPEARKASAASPADPASSDLTALQPEATLVSSPLLLADPEINSLARLDAEMARSALNRDVEIRYQEEALNREIAALWEQNPELPFRDVRVDLKRGQVVITGKTAVLGVGVSARVAGRIVAQDCLPSLQMESVSVAGVAAPAFIRKQVADTILEVMTWYPEDYPLCVEEIVLDEARVTVHGHCR
jgi:hypothetical protein